jgi:hypothetical protein
MEPAPFTFVGTMAHSRYRTRFVLAFTGLAVCAFASICATILLAAAAPVQARAGSPASFVQRVVAEIAGNDYAAAWQTLYPGHQRVASQPEYVHCELRSPIPGQLDWVRVLRVSDEKFRVPGGDQRLATKAVSVRLKIVDRTLGSSVVVGHTIHVVNVGGDWRWILPAPRYELYRDGRCAGGPPPQIAS